MSIGPLRRSVGALGLVALVPIVVMLAIGAVSPVDAAWRAAITFMAVVLLGRVAGQGVAIVASSLERRVEAAAGDARTEDQPPADQPVGSVLPPDGQLAQ